eukprot:3291393-Prymnesium_polylepis.1
MPASYTGRAALRCHSLSALAIVDTAASPTCGARRVATVLWLGHVWAPLGMCRLPLGMCGFASGGGSPCGQRFARSLIRDAHTSSASRTVSSGRKSQKPSIISTSVAVPASIRFILDAASSSFVGLTTNRAPTPCATPSATDESSSSSSISSSTITRSSSPSVASSAISSSSSESSSDSAAAPSSAASAAALGGAGGLSSRYATRTAATGFGHGTPESASDADAAHIANTSGKCTPSYASTYDVICVHTRRSWQRHGCAGVARGEGRPAAVRTQPACHDKASA